MTQALDLIEQATDLLREVACADRTAMTDAEVIALLTAEEFAGRLLDTSRALSAGEIADRSRFELGSDGLSFKHGHRKPLHFVEQLTRTSQGEAHRRIRVGEAIRARSFFGGESRPPEHEALSEAMLQGLVGIDSALAIITCMKQARLGSEATYPRPEAAENALIEQAGADCADLVWNAGRAWRDRLDPDGAEPRYEQILDKTGVTIGRQYKGLKTFTITADPISSAILESAMAESTMRGGMPRFMSEEDAARGKQFITTANGELIERMVEPRTSERRRFDGLIGVVTAGIRATTDGPVETRTIASVNATVSLKDLQSDPMFRQSGVGRLEGSGEVLPISAVQEMVCDSGFTVTILGEGLVPLAMGRVERSHTRAQRRAIVARDGDRCIAVGCQMSASASHVHHVVFWSMGGTTDVDNGVFLCPAHHHALHAGAFEVRMVDRLPYIRLKPDRNNPSAWRRAGRTPEGTLIGSS